METVVESLNNISIHLWEIYQINIGKIKKKENKDKNAKQYEKE
jgi:hypothetical protein